jgi:hypothetical protein
MTPAQLHAGGLSIREVASIIGTPKDTAHSDIKKGSPLMTREEFRQVACIRMDLAEQAKADIRANSTRAMAADYGVQDSTISLFARGLVDHPVLEEHRDEIMDRLAVRSRAEQIHRRHCRTQISKDTGVSVGTLSKWYKKRSALQSQRPENRWEGTAAGRFLTMATAVSCPSVGWYY